MVCTTNSTKAYLFSLWSTSQSLLVSLRVSKQTRGKNDNSFTSTSASTINPKIGCMDSDLFRLPKLGPYLL